MLAYRRAPTRDAPMGITVQYIRPFFAPLKGTSPQRAKQYLPFLAIAQGNFPLSTKKVELAKLKFFIPPSINEKDFLICNSVGMACRGYGPESPKTGVPWGVDTMRERTVYGHGHGADATPPDFPTGQLAAGRHQCHNLSGAPRGRCAVPVGIRAMEPLSDRKARSGPFAHVGPVAVYD